MTVQTVVVPIDGSTLSLRAVPAAAAVAAAGQAKVRLVTVAHNDGELAWAYDQVHAAAEQLPANITSAADVLVDGDPVGVLLDIADDPDNVLCFSTHDRPWLASELLGRIGSRVVDRASHPFLVVAANGSAPTVGGDVVVGLDGVSDPEPVLSAAVRWALRLGAGLRIVTVYEPTPPDLRQPDHYSRSHGPPCDPDLYLDGIKRGLDGAGLTSCTTAAIPDPVSVAAGLAEHLAERPAFLLVVGGHRRHHWPTSVLRDLLRASPPPILVAQYHGVM
ncbi:MAG TPA: universal stress protein [Acidimicrobiales bacterium]|nr:universal stress protein [Acidimicrobiales bacterium]